jgi:DegV family protein with EDD domain
VSVPVAVVTDAAACLSPDRAARAGLVVVPLHVLVQGRGRVPGREITPGEVVDILRAGHERVTTSGAAPGELAAAYREVQQRTGCTEIVSVHLSAAVSGTVGAARIAAAELGPELAVRVVDSQVLGMALGYAALEGAVAAADGADAEEVERRVVARAACTRTWFYVDTLEHLRRGGRIGRAQALVGSALSIKPILTLREGQVHPAEKVRTRARALTRIVELATEAAGQMSAGPAQLAVHHLDAAPAAVELAVALRARTGVQPLVVELDPVLGVHTGPGTLAVVVSCG